MAFVDINTNVKLTLTKYGKEQLLKGKLSFKYFGFFDSEVNYKLNDEPEKIVETQGNQDTSLYNGNNSTINI
jgi:hypothetical protein